MKAMILERFGGTERFAVATVPAPVPKRGEVLVTIKAAGVNPIDVKTRRGGGIADSLRRQRPMILGWDLSGVVSKTGEGVEEMPRMSKDKLAFELLKRAKGLKS